MSPPHGVTRWVAGFYQALTNVYSASPVPSIVLDSGVCGRETNKTSALGGLAAGGESRWKTNQALIKWQA